MSNELLLEILSYASVADVFYSWLNLNWRCNAIIYSLSIKVFYAVPERSQGNQWWDSWKDSNEIIEPLRYFSSQIVCLRIDECFSSEVLNKINITDYSHVRILKLCQLNATQLDAIRTHSFPHLEHLCLAETHNFSLKILCQFKSLRSCEMQSFKMDTENSNSSSSVQSMFLRQCHPQDMHILLRHFPQMTVLKIVTYLPSSFVNNPDPIANFVHLNLESFHIYVLDVDSFTDGTNNDKYKIASELLTSISFNKPIRYILTLIIDTMNFDFEQFQQTVRKLDFVRLSCQLMWLHKYRTVPNIDCIRQIPLFNQLKHLYTNSTATCFRTIWTKTSISST